METAKCKVRLLLEFNEKENIKTLFWFLLKIVLTLIFVIYIVNFFEDKKCSILYVDANIFLIIFAFILSFFNLYLQFERWKYFCVNYIGERDNKTILNSLLAGFAAGLISPMRVGEHFGRLYFVKGKSVTRVFLGSILDKLMSLIFIALFGLLALIFALRLDNVTPSEIIVSVSIILFLLAIFFVNLIFDSDFFKNYLLKKIDSFKKFENLKNELLHINSLEQFKINEVLFYSALLHIIILLQFALLVAAFSNDYNLVYFMSAGALMLMVKSFFPSVSIGDIGVRETASVFFLGLFNVSEGVAISASLSLFLFNALLPSIIGAILFFAVREKKKI